MVYLLGLLINASVMVWLKKKNESQLMLRCILSTLIGEGIDAIIFITIAFAGTMPLNDLLIMIIAQAMFKTVFEIVFYPITRIIIGKIKTMAE